ncbi:MAG: FtsW/RodA/SpoVE family cell cycle protein [Actinomycetota bacterium]|nr:FtsW/RodA/SpoVE family cell cycle protein [Actinomycetota bacterium]
MTAGNNRNREFIGLLLATATLIFGAAIVVAARGGAWDWPKDIWLVPAALLVTHLILRFKARRADPLLLSIAAFLSVLGLIELRSLGSSTLFVQQIWMVLGLAAVVAVVLLIRDPDHLGEFKYLAGLGGIVLLLAPIFVGTIRGGSKLWLVVGGYSFQPAEPAKILLVIFLAAYLAEKKEVLAAGRRRLLGLAWPPARHFGPLIVTWLVSVAILVLERDLGSSLIFFTLFLVMLYIATGRPVFVFVGMILFLSGADLAYRIFPHVASRVHVWLNPLPADVSGAAYQVAQSLFALAAGGISGTGLGAGLLGRQVAMPAVHTDFIFSAVGEELGLAGAAVIILAYMLLVERGWHIALRSKSDFSMLLAAGLATVTGIQTVVIVGGVIKLIPLTGVTLPFMSYGGSSVVSSFIIVGLLLSISAQNNAVKT